MSGESPFARGPLTADIGLDGKGDAVEDILKGKYKRDLGGLDEASASSEMKNFIKVLKIPISLKTEKSLEPMPITYKNEDYVESFSKTRESTTPSPSGLHYGHYIAACESETLTTMNVIFMRTPLQVGIPLTRWTKSLYCMIQKKAKPYINKLHIVQLYEADFNTMLKLLLGKRLMKYGKDHGLNGHQLYGSRKGKSTYDILITVRIIYDMARVQWDHIIFMFNDLAGYYDRICPAVNKITTRRMGLPKSVAVYHAATLQKMKHHIRTRFDISKSSLQWDKENNNGVLGQGNG